VNLKDVASGYYVGYDEDMKLAHDFIGTSSSMVATAQDVGVYS
tara:strand:+ start:94 stop:222 length:129 start_codon:yes stop_codon:yes gene_type:complete